MKYLLMNSCSNSKMSKNKEKENNSEKKKKIVKQFFKSEQMCCNMCINIKCICCGISIYFMQGFLEKRKVHR